MSGGPAAMELQAFSCLVLHASCLAELGLLRAVQGLPADAAVAAPAALPSWPALDPAAMDWQALDGLSLGDPAAAPAPSPAQASEAAALQALLAVCELGPPAMYAAAAAHGATLARLLARCDQARLAAQLAALPDATPPLDAPLDAAGLEHWARRLGQGDAALQALVAELRALVLPP